MNSCRMAAPFDPYVQWLKIPPNRQPPTYYDLLGLTPLECDVARVHAASQEKIEFLRSLQMGPQRELVLRLIGEVSKADACLTNQQRKSEYDAELLAAHPELRADIVAPAPAERVTVGGELPQSLGALGSPLRPVPLAGASLPNRKVGQAVSRRVDGGAVTLIKNRKVVVLVTAAALLLVAPVAAVIVVSQPRLPELASVADQVVDEGKLLSLQVDTVEPQVELTPFRFRLADDPPAGATVDELSGLFTWMPNEQQGPGKYQLHVRLSREDTPESYSEIHFDVVVNERDTPATIAVIDDQTVDELETLEVQVQATDPDVPPRPIAYSLGPGTPVGAKINPQTGFFTWTPSESQGPGTYRIPIVVSKQGNGTQSTQSMNVTVGEVPQAPVVTPVAGHSVTAGQELHIAIQAKDLDEPASPLTFALAPGVHSDAKLDPKTGEMSWTTAFLDPGTVVPFTISVVKRGAGDEWTTNVRFEVSVKDWPKELTNNLGMKFVILPPGEFAMGTGATAASQVTQTDEQPAHRVKCTKLCYLGVYEVTQDEYQRVVGANPSCFSSSGEKAALVQGLETKRFPVEQITWENALSFCKELSLQPEEQRAGRTYRLPTEAEWEYACRAGAGTLWHGGDDPQRVGVFAVYSPNSRARPYPVGSKTPNALGLFDMHGNVAEWCHDLYSADYYAKSPIENPTGPVGRALHVFRGGGWNSSDLDCRSARRRASTSSSQFFDVGFRVVCEPNAARSSAENP